MKAQLRASIFWSIITVISRLAVSFGIFWILANVVSLESFGIATYQLTVAVVVSLAIDYGFNLKLSRDLVNEINDTQLVWDALVAKCILGVLILVPVSLFLRGSENYLSFVILLAAQFLNMLGSTYFPLLRAQDRYRKESQIVIGNNLITFLSFVGLIGLGYSGILALAFSLLLGKGLLAGSFLAAVYSQCKTRSVSKKLKFAWLFENGSFLLHAAAGFLYINLDTILVKELLGYESVGLYQAAMRVLIAACLLSEVFNNVFIPRLIRYGYREDKRPIIEYHLQKWLAFSASGLLIAGAYFLLMKLFVDDIFGSDYQYSTAFCLFMSLVIVLRYSGIYPGILLTLSNKQRYRVVGGFVAIGVLVIACNVLVPVLGLEGIALASVLAHVAINAVYFWAAISELTRAE